MCAWAGLDATREEILAALHNAQCDDILEKLPQGVDTVIGTKRRLSLRRRAAANCHRPCHVKNAPIIILDEATAFADPDNEIRVQAAFSKLSKERRSL